MKDKSYCMQNNTPLTGSSLLDILSNKVPEEVLSKPILMSIDEEGNGFGKLYQIDITNVGITLWPAEVL